MNRKYYHEVLYPPKSSILTTSPVTIAPAWFSIEHKEPTIQGKLLVLQYSHQRQQHLHCLQCEKLALPNLDIAEPMKWPRSNPSIIELLVLTSMI